MLNPELPRRRVVRGAAWSIPAVAVATGAPALAASPVPGSACGTIAYPSPGSAAGRIVPITLSDGKTIYAKFSPSTGGSTQSSNTSPYNATFGRTAYGSVYGNYTISSVPNFVFNQMSARPSSESLTVSFYSDAAATQSTAVTNLAVPINDFSTGTSWSCGIFDTNCTPINDKSLQDVVTMTATTTAGTTVAATATGMTGTQSQNAQVPAPAGNLSTGMYLPVGNAVASPSSNGTSYGGTLNTTFGSASVTSFTFGYRGNAETATAAYSGAQGISLAPFTVCR